jgi:hypothetical protein
VSQAYSFRLPRFVVRGDPWEDCHQGVTLSLRKIVLVALTEYGEQEDRHVISTEIVDSTKAAAFPFAAPGMAQLTGSARLSHPALSSIIAQQKLSPQIKP